MTPELADAILALTHGDYGKQHVKVVLAALDAERAAHAQTRTALKASTIELASLAAIFRRELVPSHTRSLTKLIEANQVVLGLAVAEADKPHDGNER